MFTRSLAISTPAIRRAATTKAVHPSILQFSTIKPRSQRRYLTITHPSRIFGNRFQVRHLSTEVRAALDTASKSAPVVLFMKGTPETPQCGFSRTSIQILGLQGVDPSKFTAFNVLEDQDLRQGIKEYSNWPTIPQLYVDGEFVGGCDILMGMHKDGTLAELLDGKGALVAAEGE